jgi:hypothetical protein
LQEVILLLIGLASGGIGYLAMTFWFKPIIKYLEVRHEVTSDLTFFANVMYENNINKDLVKRAKNRHVHNRKHASELIACFYRLPFWYKWLLKIRSECPMTASKNLIGLSNASNEQCEVHEKALRKALRLKDE